MKLTRFSGCRRTWRWWGLGAVIVLAAATSLGKPVFAEPINFFPTGNAERDLSPSRFPNVVILIDNPLFPDNPTNDVAQAQFMTDEGWLSGWNFKDLRFLYDPSNDTMGVSVNFFKNPDGTGINIAGDADGNGNPNTSDPRTIAAGGIDQPNFRGTESITVALDLDRDGVPDVVAGIPADKPGDGLAAFTVARLSSSPRRRNPTRHRAKLRRDPHQQCGGVDLLRHPRGTRFSVHHPQLLNFAWIYPGIRPLHWRFDRQLRRSRLRRQPGRRGVG